MPGLSTTPRKRVAFAMAAALGAGILAGCPPMPTSPNQTQPATRPTVRADKFPEAPVLGFEPVAKGVFVSIDRRTPLTDAALVRAKLSRQEVLASTKAIAQPATTQPATEPAPAALDTAAADTRDAEPPPLAVKYYLQGREKFLEGANSDAMVALEKALQLDPQAFTVLRLMGRVCFAGSQLARGAMYLQRAEALRPQDVEVNYLLGRYFLERADNDRAVYYLMQAEDSPDRQITSTHTPLSAFYLGIALQQAGFHLAAAREFEHFIEVAELPVPGYRYDAELSYLINMQWASHLSAAENFARAGDYHASVPHYRSANSARPGDAFIGSRLVNALVHDGQTQPAQKAALALLAATKGTEDAVKLLGWTYRAAGRDADLIRDLRAYLQSTGVSDAAQDQAAAITLSSTQEFLGDKKSAMLTLSRYLENHPADLDVLGRVIKHVDSDATYAQALEAAARTIAADRDKTEPVVRMFVPLAEGQVGSTYIKGKSRVALKVAELPARAAGKNDPLFAVCYLEGITRQAQNEPTEKVAEAFQASLVAGPDYFPAREAYVSYLLAQEKFAQANTLIDAAMKENPSLPKVWQLQIESETAQQRYIRALQLAQDARVKFPGNIDIRMQLVQVYRLRGQDKDADAELQTIIKDMPKCETAYRALINSLFNRSRRGGAEGNSNLVTIVAALNKLATEIPDSRFGRISTAIIYARGGRYEESENLLRVVLATEPDQAEALVPLAQIETLVGPPIEGTNLLENALKRKPQVEVVRTLAAMYRDQDRKADALALTKRYASENPDSEAYALLYALELSAQEKRADATAVLTDAVKKFPRSQAVAVSLARLLDDANDHEAAVAVMRDFMKANGESTERLYLLAHFYASAANDDASVAALQRVLSIMPDHIGANNDLGYFWVNAGIHLDQAEPMIRKALENKPDDPAFLDSLAWFYYKSGRFTEAAAMLEKALALPDGLAPEVVQHLGDTLYRLNRDQDAIEKWASALQMIQTADRQTTADGRVKDYLTKVIADARAGKTPVLSPLVETDKVKSAGPATAPVNANH